ncbi:MAG: DUF4097 family beta strand repeat-containing protein [Ktedonobacteraceae bacterium]
MNEQEMQFASPDWQPPTQPSAQLVQLSTQKQTAFYSDPTLRAEQDHTWDKDGTIYQQGYQGQKASIAHYQAPGYQGIMGTRRRLWPWLVLTVILISLVPVLLSAMAMFAAQNNHSSTPVHENQTFMKGQHAWHSARHAPETGRMGGSQLVLHSYGYDMAQISMLQIDDPTGSIHVHGSMSGSRSQIEALSDNSVPDPLQFVQGTNGTLTLKVNAPTDDNPVLLDITLPQNMGLALSTNGGNIEVDGINGQVNLHTASSIALSNDTISGQSSIASAQGEVSIVNSVLSGNYVVTSEHGPIALQQVNLSGQGQIQALAEASIMLVGILEPQGNYTFTSAHGEIDLALPSDSALRLHIDPGTGSSICDFPTQTRNGAALTVKTESGNIQIRQGP